LQDKKFGADFPKPQFPGEKDVSQVIKNAGDEEKVPAKETLFPNGHFT
jgi:hypothetical protein